MKYTCLRCNKEFNQKIHLTNHNNRIRPCKMIILNEINNDNHIEVVNNNINNLHQNAPICTEIAPNSTEIAPNSTNNLIIQMNELNDLECKYCKKIFVRKFVLKRHIDENRCKTKQMIDEQNNNKETMIELLMKQIEEKDKKYQEIINEKDKIHQNQIDILTTKLQKMETKIIKTTNKNNINNINTNTNTNNGSINTINNNNITIKFGDETSLIDYSELLNKKELEYILKKQRSSILASIEMIHFNKRLPQCMNVYLSAKNSKNGLIFDGIKYKLDPLDNIIDNLYNDHKTYVESLVENCEELNLNYTSKYIENIIDLIRILDEEYEKNQDDKSFKLNKKYEIYDEIKLLLYNEKELTEKKHMEIKKSLELENKRLDRPIITL